MTAPTWGCLALGTWEFGSTLRPGQCRQLLDTHVTLGGRLVDTAPTYGPGPDGAHHAEPIIGAWLAATGSDIRVATKAGLHPHTHRPDLDPDALLRSADCSRGRLGLPRLDLFLLHRDDPTVPVDEVADVLARLVTSGTAAATGVSNWRPARLRALAGLLAQPGRPDLRATAPLWSLARRARAATDPELVQASATHLRIARAHHLQVLAYRATALGFFATGPDQPPGRHAAYLRVAYHTPVNLARLGRARRLADLTGRTAHQVALAWLRSFDLTVTPVVGATTPAQLRESAAGCATALTPAHRDYLTDGRPL